VKSLVVKLDDDGPVSLTVAASKAGTITGADVETPPSVDIINKEQVIATLTENVDFHMEMVVEKGRGYVPAGAEDEDATEQEVGVIPIDAIFSPVRRVRYKTEETRVGQRINYDRLIMEIWTDGTIGPELALVEAAKILRKHLGPFVQYFELGLDLAESQVDEALEGTESDLDEDLQKKLAEPVSTLELTVRATNCLEMAKIETIGDLVNLSESEILNIRSFGKTSLREVKRKLADIGLEFGMNLEKPAEPES
jgi:DNA-directed RNA polymerase subunit alpha